MRYFVALLLTLVCFVAPAFAEEGWDENSCLTCNSPHARHIIGCIGSYAASLAYSAAEGFVNDCDAMRVTGDAQAYSGFKSALQAELDDQIEMEAISPEDAAACQTALNNAGTAISVTTPTLYTLEDYVENCYEKAAEIFDDGGSIDGYIDHDYTTHSRYCSTVYLTYYDEYTVTGCGTAIGLDGVDGVKALATTAKSNFDSRADYVDGQLAIASALLYP